VRGRVREGEIPGYADFNLARRSTLYAAATRWAASCERACLLNRVFLKLATVFVQPKI